MQFIEILKTIVLGIILGPLAEENFLRGRLIANTDVGLWQYFFSGTLNQVLIGLCVLSLAYAIFSEIRFARRAKARLASQQKEAANA